VYAAKPVVTLCCVMLYQVSYAIGVAEPLSIFISSYGTGIKTDSELLKIVKANFDLRPGKIVRYIFSHFRFTIICILFFYVVNAVGSCMLSFVLCCFP